MKLAVGVVLCAVLCAGCYARTLTTPSIPLTYGWVMAHDWDNWGVQIGPKTDPAGTHVAVYGWRDCHPVCAWEFFQRYDVLVPGSVHDYAVIWQDDGWHLTFDGYDRAVLNVGNPQTAHYETNIAERTAA